MGDAPVIRHDTKVCEVFLPWIYFRISGDVLSVGGDVPIDDEAPTVAS